MNYLGFTKGGKSQDNNIKQLKDQEKFEQLDPVVKRYLNMKYGLKAAGVALSVWTLKLLVQNLTRRKYIRMSPWIQLFIASAFYASQPLPLYDDLVRNGIIKRSENRGSAEKEQKLMQYRMKFYTNSQYWH